MKFEDCRYLIAGIAAITMGGCGGGGGGGSNEGSSSIGAGSTTGGGNQPATTLTATANEAEGYYSSKLADAKSYLVTVLDDGEFWILISDDSGANASLITGVGAAQNGSFSASNVLDFKLVSRNAPVQGSLSASYRAKSIFNATLSENSNTTTFAASYDPSYTQPYPLATIAGNYTGSFGAQGNGFIAANTTSFNLTIANTGAVTGSIKNVISTDPACTFQGSVTQRSPNKNPYRISISINESNCFIGASTFTGIFQPFVQNIVQKGIIHALSQDKSKALISTISK